MSDGDNAAPGRRPPGPPDDADPSSSKQWLTRSMRPTPGAAPWERSPISKRDVSDQVDDDAEPSAGNHTDGVTVADLIATTLGELKPLI